MQSANVLHKDLTGADLHPPGPHTHVEADITNLNKYTRAETDALLAAAIAQFQGGGGGSTPDATALIKGKLALAGDLAGTAAAPTVPGLATKQNTLGFTPEDTANKITDPAFTANSDTYYPSQKATKAYVDNRISGREPAITGSLTTKYWRGDKTFQTLDTSVVPENGNLYFSNARFDSRFATKTTSDLVEGANLYYTDARVRANRLDQMTAPIASVSMNGQKITSLADPSSAQDAATKAYVDSVATGLTVKASVVAATTANITLSGPQTIDGVSVIAGDRVLVKNQTTGADNGIYVVASGAWSRASDADTSPEVTSGMFMFVQQGTVNGDASFVLTTPNPITLGTTALSFTQFSGAADLIGGAGLVRTANTFDVIGTANRILVNADSIDIAATYVGQASITTLGTISTGVWNGSAIPVAYGGTGAGTAAAARTNLGAVNIAGDTMTGALTVPNLTNSALTSGSIVYAGSGGLLANDNANLFYDAANKVLAIGTNTPNANAPFNSAAFEIDNTGGAHSDIVQRVAAGYGTHFFAASNGTIASPTITAAGNGLGNLEFLGYTGAAYAVGAFIGTQVAPSGTVGSTSMPTNILFQNALRKQVNISANAMIISSKKAITLWGGLSSDPTSANFRIDQPAITLPGVVQTAGTTALVGTETLFTNDFKVGDTINVQGETSRIVATITDDTHLTATVAFSSSASSLTYQTPARTVFTARGNGQVGIGTSTPTAFLHLPAGTANATTAPLKFTSGTNLTSPEAGAVEYDGTLMYYTTGSLTRQTLATKAYVDAQVAADVPWGGIIGTLSAQTDLQAALNAKVALAGGTMTGALSFSGTTNPGVILNSLTTTQRNLLTPSNGMLINNSTLNQVQKYENGHWVETSKSAATVTIAPAGSGYAADYYTTGTSDETVINAAITAVNALGGGTILLKTGTYTATTTGITLLSNVILRGEGLGTYVTLANGANVSLIDIEGKQNVVIQDMYIDGNGVNQTIEKHAIRIGQASSYVDVYNCRVVNGSHHNVLSVLDGGFSHNDHIRVINCHVSGAGAMVEATNDGACIALQGDYCLAQGNFITDTSFVGIEIYHDGNHSSAVNNYIIWNGQSDTLGAIQVGTNNENSVISGNIITGTGVAGHAAIKVLANYCTITNNTIFDLTNGHGIWVSGGSFGTYANNTIKNIAGEGFYIEGTYNTFMGNNVYAALIGMDVRPAGSNSTLIGNICSNNQQYGIFTNSAASTVILDGNTCANNGTSAYATYDGIQSQAVNTTIVNNQCYDTNTIPFQRFGIRISGSSNNFVANSNYTNGNVSGGVSLSGNGSSYNMAFNNSDNNITINGEGARTLSMTRPTLADNIAGQSFTVQSGAASTQGTNFNGGTAFVKGGISTGSGTSQIQFQTAGATTNTLSSLASVAISNRGSGYTVSDVLTVTGGGGSSGTATVSSVAAAGQLSGSSINAGGSGYVIGNVLTIAGGTGGQMTVSVVDGTGKILSASLSAQGSGYTGTTGATVTGGAGTGATFNTTIFSTGAITGISLTTAGTGYALTLGATTSGGTGTAATLNIVPYSSADNSVTTKMTILGNGKVGIGITTPSTMLDVRGVKGATLDPQDMTFQVADTNTMAINNGGGIGFVATYKADGSLAGIASIVSLKEDGTDGNYGGHLAFNTRVNGQIVAETMRLTSDGKLGIGITGPTARLHLKAGTATANTAPLKFNSGINMTVAESGAMEYDGTLFYLTTSTPTRKTIALLGNQTWPWTEVTGTTQAAAVNSGYILNNAGLVTLTLPAIAAVGDVILVVGKGAGGWKVAQNASGVIHFGNLDSTTGTGGFISSTAQYDCVMLVCIVANNGWVVQNSVGNITVN